MCVNLHVYIWCGVCLCIVVYISLTWNAHNSAHCTPLVGGIYISVSAVSVTYGKEEERIERKEAVERTPMPGWRSGEENRF